VLPDRPHFIAIPIQRAIAKIAMNFAAHLFGGVVMKRYRVTMIVAVSFAWSVQ